MQEERGHLVNNLDQVLSGTGKQTAEHTRVFWSSQCG